MSKRKHHEIDTKAKADDSATAATATAATATATSASAAAAGSATAATAAATATAAAAAPIFRGGTATDRKASVLLVMDYQSGILERVVPNAAHRTALVTRAAAVIAAARAAAVPVVFARMALRASFANASKDNKIFGPMIGGALNVDGTADTAIPAALAPLPDEPVLVKPRMSCFHGTELETLLRSQGARHVVLFGVSTSGCVLSTVRFAADCDYTLTVAKDCCYDWRRDVHDTLMDVVLARQCNVVSADALIAALKA